jgi:hypothetical protein
MPEVDSSLIKYAEHDPQSETLTVQFQQGRRYVYEGVPAETHAALLASDSPGKFFHRWIKPFYSGTEITED